MECWQHTLILKKPCFVHGWCACSFPQSPGAFPSCHVPSFSTVQSSAYMTSCSARTRGDCGRTVSETQFQRDNRKRRNGQNLRKNHWLCHWIDVARCCPECASSEEDRRNNIFDLLDKTSNILNNYIIHLQTCGGICFVILEFRNLYRASISVDFRNIQQPPQALQSMDAKILSILHYSFA